MTQYITVSVTPNFNEVRLVAETSYNFNYNLSYRVGYEKAKIIQSMKQT